MKPKEAYRALVQADAEMYVASWELVLAASWPRERGPADEDPSWLYLPCLGGRVGRLYSDIAPIIVKLERMGVLERHHRHAVLIRHRMFA
ncbi:MAG: hypothetical protein L6Q63_02395 [Giesbergeria sp.]|nr:hypothetical protein [Giesbergeria sp.]